MPKPRNQGGASRGPPGGRRAAPEERPELTPDDNVEAGVRDTFPASDPLSATTVQGSRAVPPERLLRDDAAAPTAGTVLLTARFAGHEAAKLAIEALVREGPLDRRCVALHEERGGAATVTVRAPAAEADRLHALLRQQGGACDPLAPRGP
ncbi:hypothetical protein [Caldovatus aquaticus]|uniref:Uncharacterized protein n=1 Tax=Caldovatus aquaticus TaxID=2865671 RepID=A0ABS7F3I9_9PROT|nr:hypothetical protein [Caldovatus aquaticus]MBW8269365.1 hypothetical protein [Caldovatus aquaticus]